MVGVSFPAGTKGIKCCACGGRTIVTRDELHCPKCGAVAKNEWFPRSNHAKNADPNHAEQNPGAIRKSVGGVVRAGDGSRTACKAEG